MLANLLPDNFLDPALRTLDNGLSGMTLVFTRLTPDFPPEIWWLPLVVLLILGGTAAIDAVKGRIPDPPIFVGLLLTVATLGFCDNWPLAAERLATGFGAALVLYAVNQLYYNWRNTDAIGMGDAKWTALAITAFGLKPAVYAWVIGACLGLAWLTAIKTLNLIHRLFTATAAGRDIDRIHFAPFLFTALLATLYWNTLR